MTWTGNLPENLELSLSWLAIDPFSLENGSLEVWGLLVRDGA